MQLTVHCRTGSETSSASPTQQNRCNSGKCEEGLSFQESQLADFDAKFGGGVIEKSLSQRPEVARAGSSARDRLRRGPGADGIAGNYSPPVELHGINKKPWSAMRGPKSLIATAANYGIFTKEEARPVSLPVLHFYDATELRFPDVILMR